MRKRVSCGVPPFWSRNGSSLAGTVMRILVAVAVVVTLRKMARAPSRLKTTVFLFLPGRKFLPVIVMTSPTPSFMGEIFVIVG